MFLIVTRLLMMERLIDKYDVTSEFVNALPRDIKLLSLAEQAEKAAGAKYDDGLDLSLWDFNFHIAHVAQPTAITDIDNLFASQLTEFQNHIPHLWGSLCAVAVVL